MPYAMRVSFAMRSSVRCAITGHAAIRPKAMPAGPAAKRALFAPAHRREFLPPPSVGTARMFGSALGALHCSFLIPLVITPKAAFREAMAMVKSIGEGRVLPATTIAAIARPINIKLCNKPATATGGRQWLSWRPATPLAGKQRPGQKQSCCPYGQIAGFSSHRAGPVRCIPMIPAASSEQLGVIPNSARCAAGTSRQTLLSYTCTRFLLGDSSCATSSFFASSCC